MVFFYALRTTHYALADVPGFLADADDGIKLVFGVIVAIIWGISALASFLKKQQKESEEQRRHRENWERINQEMRARAATAQTTLSQPQGWATPPHLPPNMPPLPPVPQARPATPPPPPVFAPTRSIEARPVPVRQPVQVRQPPPRRVIPVAQPASRQAPPRPKQKAKKQKSRGLPPAPPLPAAATAAAVPIAARASSDAQPAARTAGPAPADAAALSRWLNARTLRSQFILTEILQPPLALRDPGDAQQRGL